MHIPFVRDLQVITEISLRNRDFYYFSDDTKQLTAEFSEKTNQLHFVHSIHILKAVERK